MQNYCGVRPAINLSMDNILFTSAATFTLSASSSMPVYGVSAKSQGGMDTELTALPQLDSTNRYWKLTMKDTNYGDFKAEATSIDPETGDITVKYSGAKTGEEEYVAVMIKDREYKDGQETAEESLKEDGDFVYYARLKDLSDENPSDTTDNTDKTKKGDSNKQVVVDKAVKTGDYSNYALWIILAVLSVGAIVAAIYVPKKISGKR